MRLEYAQTYAVGIAHPPRNFTANSLQPGSSAQIANPNLFLSQAHKRLYSSTMSHDDRQ
jgi:hypothetical protein